MWQNLDLRDLLSFVRFWLAHQLVYVWRDDDGITHDILQGEGGEQGDPLMPANLNSDDTLVAVLDALGQHRTLRHAAAQLNSGDTLVAFLDDLYLLTTRDRAVAAYQTVAEAVRDLAGAQSN